MEKFRPENIAIGNIFTKRDFYIGGYQRPFCWEKQNINRMLDDITDFYKNWKDEEMYFIGAIYILFDVKRYFIIDGQQRITFFYFLFLTVWWKLKRYSGNAKKDLSENALQNFYLMLAKLSRLLFIEEKNKNSKNRLKSHGIDKNILQLIISYFKDSLNIDEGKFLINIKSELEKEFKNEEAILFRNYYDLIEIIWEKLNKMNLSELSEFAEIVFESIIVIEIPFQDTSLHEVLNVFLRMNNSGKKLDDLDIIKAQIFQKYYPNKASKDCTKVEKIWEKLIKDSLTETEGLSSLTKYFNILYRVFYKGEKKVETKMIKSEDFIQFLEECFESKEGGIDSFFDFIQDRKKTYSFTTLIDGFKENHGDKKEQREKKLLFNLYLDISKKAKFKNYHDLLFKCLFRFHKGQIELKNVIETFEVLFKFTLFYQVFLGAKTQSIPPIFKKVLSKIEELEGSQHIDKKKIWNRKVLQKLFEESTKEKDFLFSDKNKIKKAILKLKNNNKYAINHKIILCMSELCNGKEKNLTLISYLNDWFKMGKNEKKFHLDHIIPKEIMKYNQKVKKESIKNKFEILKNSNGEKQIKILDDKWAKNKSFEGVISKNIISFEKFKNIVIDSLGNHQILTEYDNKSLSNKPKGVFSSFDDLIERRNNIITKFFKSILFEDAKDTKK